MRLFSQIIRACFVILVLTASRCSLNDHGVDKDVRLALEELDATLQKSGEFISAKEARIDSLRRSSGLSSPGEEQYHLYDAIFDEYLKWNCDSAMTYAHKKEALAASLGLPILINDAAEDLARRYILSGMYHHAMDILSRGDAKTGSAYSTNPTRTILLYEIYHGIVLASSDDAVRREYSPYEAHYLELAISQLDKDSFDYYNLIPKYMIPAGRRDELLRILESRLSAGDLAAPEKAMFYYWIGHAYDTMGDEKNAVINYSRSAVYDLESPTREYRSLILVAEYCDRHNLTTLAYRCITRSYEDALVSDAKIRSFQIGETLAKVSARYDENNQRHQQIISVMLIILSVSIMLLTLAAAVLVVNRRKLFLANREINRRVHDLKESNRLKDTYIGQFLSMFSNQIDALERYRSLLRITSKQRDYDALLQELHSDSFIDAEWKNLYEKFDSIFLGLFPDFVEQLNALLRPDQRLTVPSKGKLTNEIRVFAMIRLGITDSARIAKFLRKSITTIYNYRVKLRNAAVGSRDSFEDRVMHIGA